MSLFPEAPPALTGDNAADIAALYAYIQYLTQRLEWYMANQSNAQS